MLRSSHYFDPARSDQQHSLRPGPRTMFLINVNTIQLEYHCSNNIPPYTILSHRWGDEEVNHQTFRSSSKGGSLRGYAKIVAACRQSRERNVNYTWVDTCCIDKTSSAELTESINSMFNWYQNAVVCFAFLEDIVSDRRGLTQLLAGYSGNLPRTAIGRSDWMQRGWTLQELLAPSRVEFYATDWTFIGTRHQLAAELSAATGIARQYLLDEDNQSVGCRLQLMFKASVAERMSWAARRVTTRTEDEAYCLLGLFGVNMPLIYGEGRCAFRRLQEEILQHSFDPTLLAWGSLSTDRPMVPSKQDEPLKLLSVANYLAGNDHPWSHRWFGRDHCTAPDSGFLAPEPRCFLYSSGLIAAPNPAKDWALTPRGLRINLPVSRMSKFEHQPYLLLPCFERHNPLYRLAVPIRAMSEDFFLRKSRSSVFVHATKYDQWQSEDVVLARDGDNIPVDESFQSDGLRCDVWIRSKGFTLLDLPVSLGDTNDGAFVKADQAWLVGGDHNPTATFGFSTQTADGTTLFIRVQRRGCFNSIPLIANFSVRSGSFSQEFSHTATITHPGTRLPHTGERPSLEKLLRRSLDIVETLNNGMVSIGITEQSVAERPLLVIHIRYGPSRMIHLWDKWRRHVSNTAQIHRHHTRTMSHLPVYRLIAAALLGQMKSLYQQIPYLYRSMELTILLMFTHGLFETCRIYMLFFALAPTELEILDMISKQPGKATSIITYLFACYLVWLHVSAGFQEIESARSSAMEGLGKWFDHWGSATLSIFYSFYYLLPIVSILAPRTTPFLRQHYLTLVAICTSLLSYIAPHVFVSSITSWVCCVLIVICGGNKRRRLEAEWTPIWSST